MGIIGWAAVLVVATVVAYVCAVKMSGRSRSNSWIGKVIWTLAVVAGWVAIVKVVPLLPRELDFVMSRALGFGWGILGLTFGPLVVAMTRDEKVEKGTRTYG